MTMAITKAKAQGATPCRVRVDRQHVGRRGGLRRARRDGLRRPGARGQDRPGQAGPGDGLRRRGHPGARQLRRGARPGSVARPERSRSRSSTRSTPTGSRARRPAPSRSSTRSGARPTCWPSRWATPATSPPTGAASPSTTTPGAPRPCPRCGASRPRAPRRSCSGHVGRAPRDRGHRDQDRQPGQLGQGARGGARVARRRSARSPTTRSWTRTTCWRARSRSSASRRSAATLAGLLRYGVPEGATVVCVLTGNGLKDPDTAVAASAPPPVVDASVDALLAALG